MSQTNNLLQKTTERIFGPLLGRIDIRIDVPRVSEEEPQRSRRD